VKDYLGNPLPVERSIRFVTPSAKFVCIGEGALSANMSAKTIRMVAGHPILYQGQEMPCEALLSLKLEGVKEETGEPEPVYTLVTQQRTFADVQGLPVATWSLRDWTREHGADEGRLWTSQ